jgi:hypothetical protein
MTKLLRLDLDPSVPGPIAKPMMTNIRLEVRLNMGQLQAHRWEAVHINVKDDPESPSGLTDFVQTVPFSMVSKRFVELLKKFNSECEFLPLVVHYNGQALVGEYFALNVLRVLPQALNFEHCKIGFYDNEFGFAEQVQKLVLNEELIEVAPISYLREITAIAVSEALADAISHAKLIGIHLMRPSEFKS